MRFDFDSATRRKLGYRLIDQIDAFFSSLPDRAVQLPASERTYGPLQSPLPELGEDAAQVLDEVCREMVDKGFHVPAANYFGLMNPTPTYMGVLAEALVAALNPQLATLAALATRFENRARNRSLGRRARRMAGTIQRHVHHRAATKPTSAAWHWRWRPSFPIALKKVSRPSAGGPWFTLRSEAHHSLDKSAGLLGIGRKALQRIAVNENLQLDPHKLQSAVAEDLAAGAKPFCVVATAGTTNSGTVDDLIAISDICRAHDLWLHVDGAYGAAAIFSDQHRDLVRGIERADSLTIDPHKWLAVPFAAGLILTCHPEVLERTFAVAAPYMPKAAGARLPDNSRISTQWTRRMNSLKLWLTLRVHGRKAYEELIDHQINLSRSFASWVQGSEHFELAAPHTLPIVTFRLKGLRSSRIAESHGRLVESITQDGQRWISETVVNGQSVLRMMIISYLTEETHLQELEAALTDAAATLILPAKVG